MEYVIRFNLKPKQADAFRQWLNDSSERLRSDAPAGWTYKGTFFTVRGFGNHDCETRWQLENYAAFDAENPAGFNQLTLDFIEFINYDMPWHGVLFKEADDVIILE